MKSQQTRQIMRETLLGGPELHRPTATTTRIVEDWFRTARAALIAPVPAAIVPFVRR